jgi:hypothetical protein
MHYVVDNVISRSGHLFYHFVHLVPFIGR